MEIEKFSIERVKPEKNLYVCAGNRAYIIGAQDGSFPDFGGHVKDEMGGVWNHPIKLLDGFWAKVKNSATGEEAWLTKSNSFINLPYGNKFIYNIEKLGLEIERFQFSPDNCEGVIIEYSISNKNLEKVDLDFSFLGRVDLLPVWFSNEIGIEDGEDNGQWNNEQDIFVAKDEKNPWFAVFGSDNKSYCRESGKELFGPHTTVGKGISGLATYKISVKSGEISKISFFITGSYNSEEKALETYNYIKENSTELLSKKKKTYENILDRNIVSIPDEHLEEVYNWTKFNTEWLIREVPEHGRGLGAGLPEYPWWFGTDNSYALLGVLCIGDFELVKDTLRIVKNISEKTNGNGRIIHEVSSNGATSNLGNTQETPHFINCVWKTYEWTGDESFLKEMYPYVLKGINWLLTEKDPDRDLFPEGYGIMEIEGLNLELIDTAVYTHEALIATAKMASIFGDNQLGKEFNEKAVILKDKINQAFWSEEDGIYADEIGTPDEFLERIDMMIRRYERFKLPHTVEWLQNIKKEAQALESKEQRNWMPYKNWVILTPMETGLATQEKAIRALENMNNDSFIGEWGTYLSAVEKRSIMTISTSVHAAAEAMYDRIDNSLSLVNKIANTFNKFLPGSMSEMSPDYGCFVQAWTVYGIAYPLISHIFGIKPRAYAKEICIRPILPTGWDKIKAEKIKVGITELSMKVDINENVYLYNIDIEQEGWKIEFKIPYSGRESFLLNGCKFEPKVVDGEAIITLADRCNKIEVTK